jgi:hypothetical protein
MTVHLQPASSATVPGARMVSHPSISDGRPFLAAPCPEQRDPLGFNPRHVTADALARALRIYPHASAAHRALTDEQHRRRALAQRIHQHQEVA